MPDGIIRVYGATWCPDTARARRILDKNHICFAWHTMAIPIGLPGLTWGE
jgi:glutaredoxin-related protein